MYKNHHHPLSTLTLQDPYMIFHHPPSRPLPPPLPPPLIPPQNLPPKLIKATTPSPLLLLLIPRRRRAPNPIFMRRSPCRIRHHRWSGFALHLLLFVRAPSDGLVHALGGERGEGTKGREGGRGEVRGGADFLVFEHWRERLPSPGSL